LQLVQKFVREKEYRNLMNSNRATFQSVKHETVRLSLKISEELDPIKELKVIQLINSVKDKSKQISISFVRFFPAIMKYSHIYDGVWRVSVSAYCDFHQRLMEDFSFTVFNNIYHLSLSGIQKYTKVNLFLNKLIKLGLYGCSFQEVTAWNSKETLKELIVFGGGLTRFPSFGNISTVSIQHLTSNVPYDFRVGQQTKLFFSGSHPTFPTLQTMCLPSFFQEYNGFKAALFISCRIQRCFLLSRYSCFGVDALSTICLSGSGLSLVIGV
jgi:hypothetical protein